MTSTILYEYGSLYLNQQQVGVAESSFREMLVTISDEDYDLFALANYGLARIAAAQSNINEARKLGEKSKTILESIGHRKAKEVTNWLDSITV